MARLRIGSRGSQLALWQAHHIRALLQERGHEVELEIIKTTGDKITDVALAKVGTKGMFTKEIEEALSEGRVDLAVHSLKDLPTELSREFEIAAITTRENPNDVFCSVKYNSIEELPQRARVGTSSLRRQAQLKAVRPDLEIFPLRGNVDTRLRKLEGGEYDAIILAAAGLNRLGKTELVKQIIPAEIMCPAAGQGALGIEIRAGDSETREHLAFLDDAAARATTTCERALLNKLGGGCQVPIGASAQAQNGRIHLEAIVAHPDGSVVLARGARRKRSGKAGRRSWRYATSARRRRHSRRSLRRGIRCAATTVRGRAKRPLSGVRVLVGRARHQAGALSSGLRKLGAEVVEIPFIEIRRPRSYKPLDTTLKNLETYDWLILTSVNGVDALWERLAKLRIGKKLLGHLKVAAIGPATRKAIEKRGLRVDVVPEEYVAESVVKSLRSKVRGKRVLLARAKVARDVIPRELRKLGAQVDVVEAYETVVPSASRTRLRAMMRNPAKRPHVITFTSSSTVKNFVALAGKIPSSVRNGITLASIGPVTSATLGELGLGADIEAKEYTIPGLIQAILGRG